MKNFNVKKVYADVVTFPTFPRSEPSSTTTVDTNSVIVSDPKPTNLLNNTKLLYPAVGFVAASVFASILILKKLKR